MLDPPRMLAYATPPASRPSRPLALIGIGVTAVLAGPLVGITTNAINGSVSPTYFINVMGWQLVSGVWEASLDQGLLDGLVVGVILSAIFTISLGIITRATCGYMTALRCLLGILLSVYCLWAIGGLLGMVLASNSPGFFRSTFIGVPADHKEMLRYAWVGGSIWGEEFGGLLAVIVGLVLFWLRWKRRQRHLAG